MLGLFVHVNYYRKDERKYRFEEENVEQVVVINDGSALAPHGVPTNPIARSVSRQNVEPNMESQPVVNQNNNNNILTASNSGNQYQSTDQYWDPNQAWN